MIKIFIFLLFLSHNLLFSFIITENKQQEKKVQDLITNGLSFVNQGRYELALEEFNLLEKEVPEHPASYFFKSATILWIMIHYRKYNLEQDFLKWNGLGIEKAKDFIKENDQDAWSFFYYAGLLGFRGIYSYEAGHYFRAFLDGIKGVNQLKTVEKMDSSIVDVGYGLGLYNFWKSYFHYKILRDRESKENKEKGIEQLIATSKYGKYTQGEARKALIRIYYEEQRFDELLTVAEEELNVYPDCLYCQRYIAAAYLEQSKFNKSIAELEKIKKRISESQYYNQFSQVELDLLIARNFLEMGKIIIAKKMTDRIELLLEDIIELDNAYESEVFEENFKHLNKKFKTLKKQLN